MAKNGNVKLYFKFSPNGEKSLQVRNNTIKLRNPRTSHFQTSTGVFYMPQIFAKWRKTETSGYSKFSPSGEKRKRWVTLNSRHLAKNRILDISGI